MSKPFVVHCVLNAHLDPVWQWLLRDGKFEALSTFRLACDMLDSHEDIYFSHNEMFLYEWVEQVDPELFERVRGHVRSGRWEVLGGWYIQPDVLMPCTEGIVRQSVLGLNYFREKFGVSPTVANCFDSFGHGGGLPQILKLSGHKMYVHSRPGPEWEDAPRGFYRWEGVDGTVIDAVNQVAGHYGTPPSEAGCRERVALCLPWFREQGEHPRLLLWGYGNHGGGASEEAIAYMRGHNADPDREFEFVFSTAESYRQACDAVPDEKVPTHVGELKKVFAGCYTSMARLKRLYRQAETKYFTVEKLCAWAGMLERMSYPGSELTGALKKLLMSQFHDILPGSGTPSVERESLERLGSVMESLDDVETRALWALCKDSAYQEMEVPLFLVNPHGHAVTDSVEFGGELDPRVPLEAGLAGVRVWGVDEDGNDVPVQMIHPEADMYLKGTRRFRAAVRATVEPMSVKMIRLVTEPDPAILDRPVFEKDALGQVVLESDFVSAAVDGLSGRVVSIRSKADDRELLSGPIRFLVVDDPNGAWGDYESSWRTVVGEFVGSAAVEAVGSEKGAVFDELQVRLTYSRSVIYLSVRVYHGSAVVELLPRIEYNGPGTRLKLAIPTVLGDGAVGVDALGGVVENPQDGQEYVCQKWVCLADDRCGMAISNDGAYGYDALGGEVRLSLVRNSQYTTFRGDGWWQDTKRHPWQMDVGEHLCRVRLWVGSADEVRDQAVLEGRMLNQPLVAFPLFGRSVANGEFCGPGSSLDMSISDSRIELTAMKRAEADDGVVLRLVNHAGCDVTAGVVLEGRSVELAFHRYEIKTLFAADDGDGLEACELIR